MSGRGIRASSASKANSLVQDQNSRLYPSGGQGRPVRAKAPVILLKGALSPVAHFMRVARVSYHSGHAG